MTRWSEQWPTSSRITLSTRPALFPRMLPVRVTELMNNSIGRWLVACEGGKIGVRGQMRV